MKCGFNEPNFLTNCEFGAKYCLTNRLFDKPNVWYNIDLADFHSTNHIRKDDFHITHEHFFKNLESKEFD